MGKKTTVGAVRRKASGGNKATSADQWLLNAEEVPRAGLPDAERIAKSTRGWRRYAKASMILFPFLLLTCAVAISRSMSAAPPPAAIQIDAYAFTKADAVVAVKKWIAQNPSPLPGAVLVGWDAASTESYRGDPEEPAYNKNDDYDIEVHRLTLASPSGLLYDTTVTLAVNRLIGAVVVGEPSLIPRPPSASSFDADPWVGQVETRTSDAVLAAVESWSKAYSSGDPNALRLALQDPEELHAYMPLTGASLTNATITRAIAMEPARSEGAHTVVVQATFDIAWRGASATQQQPRVTYDLLVEKADTAAPLVVAWGGSGSGPTLKRYANAVLGRSIEAQQPRTDQGSVVGNEEELPASDKSETPGSKKDKSKKGSKR